MRFIAEADLRKETYFVAGNFSHTTTPEVSAWLDDTPGQGYSVAYSYAGRVGYYFYNEQDAMLFALRWA